MGDCKVHGNSYAYLTSWFNALGKQMDNATANLASKDVEGYIKTDINITIQNVGGVNTGISSSSPSQSVDENLMTAIRHSQSRYAKFNQLNCYYERLEALLGPRGGESTFVHSGGKMNEAILKAASNPDVTNKSTLAYAVNNHLKELNNFANNIQLMRGSIDQNINTCKDKINNILQDIANYNLQISQVTDGDPAGLTYVNARRQSLQALSELIEIKVTPFGSNGQVNVTTAYNNYNLVQGSVASTLNYTPAIAVNPNTTFGQFNLTSTNSNNLTSYFVQGNGTGYLSALFQLRDQTLVGLQQQLDNYAYNLRDKFNGIHNLGTAINPPSTMLSTIGIPGAPGPITTSTQIKGSGTLRIGILNPTTSKLTSHADIDLSGINTVNDLITAINNINGLTASITTSGQLKITTPDPNGIAIGSVGNGEAKLCAGTTYNENNAYGVSHFFGLNNLIDSPGSLPGVNIPGLASMLSIRDDILTSKGSKFAVGRLSSEQTLPSISDPLKLDLGARDVSMLTELTYSYQEKMYTFNATSTSDQITTSIQAYSKDIISYCIEIDKNNKVSIKSEKFIYDGLSETAFKKHGVDPEEILQQIYDMAASKRIAISILGMYRKMNSDLITIMLNH